jgi:hypothetical protein
MHRLPRLNGAETIHDAPTLVNFTFSGVFLAADRAGVIWFRLMGLNMIDLRGKALGR